MARYRVIYWREIPTSFTVEGDGRTVKKQLPPWVQNRIDAYAMALGLTSTADYSAQYRRGEWIDREGSPEKVAEALLVELEEEARRVVVPRRSG